MEVTGKEGRQQQIEHALLSSDNDLEELRTLIRSEVKPEHYTDTPATATRWGHIVIFFTLTIFLVQSRTPVKGNPDAGSMPSLMQSSKEQAL